MAAVRNIRFQNKLHRIESKNYRKCTTWKEAIQPIVSVPVKKGYAYSYTSAPLPGRALFFWNKYLNVMKDSASPNLANSAFQTVASLWVEMFFFIILLTLLSII